MGFIDSRQMFFCSDNRSEQEKRSIVKREHEMSWNKNTIPSDMDSIIHTLENAGVPYSVTVEKTIRGNGLNDMYGGKETVYPLRKLVYGNKVVMEQMQSHSDCDMDDVIVTVEFEKGSEPQDFQYVISIDDDARAEEDRAKHYKEYYENLDLGGEDFPEDL